MVLAAFVLRVPSALTEADAHLGLANRLAAPFARRVFCAFPIEGVDGAKVRVVGRPIPARSRPPSQADARRAFGLSAEGPVVLVFGGSQGARRLNEAAFEAFAGQGPGILHLAGERDYPALAGRPRREGYVLLPYTDEFGAALAAADLVVARAGGSVWEVAAAGKPALLVPYPHATGDHQAKNARYFERGGGALVVPEAELDIGRQVQELLADADRLGRMGQAMLALAKPDAADVVAEELIALVGA
jgi:UDP-N-acetylglucosamine--N-acetylmuramyl-(pentapeptide) pyrophosphoryl-undecaprenol N-acetylglucosamine transferase